MVCRDEHLTDTNSAGCDIVLRELRLERIAQIWQDRCTSKHNKWANKYNRRIEEANAQEEADEAFLEKYKAWWDEIVEVGYELDVLMQKFMAHEDVTPADWDTAMAGKERKVFALASPYHPKETWPRTVPYLNFVARGLYEEEEEERRKACMKQYHAAVRHINRRVKETIELKRVAGDTSSEVGFDPPVTMEQIQQWREVLRAEKEQLEVDKAQVHADLDKIILARLQEQSVLSEDWNAQAWAGVVLEDIGLAATDEVKGRVVQSIQIVIERWRLGKDEVEMTVEQETDCEGEYFLPYDV